MADATPPLFLDVFSTCPLPGNSSQDAYLRRVIEVARWSEECDCKGILVYTDNSTPDPWLIAQVIIQNTQAICPLVAVQPVYMHPYTVAKMISTLGHLYGRRVFLNMVAGGFTNDLAALGDATPHDQRYDRLVEYTTIIKQLTAGPSPVTFHGKFYQVTNLKLTPPLPAGLEPGILLSGSSAAGMASARQLGAVAIKYPKPAHAYESEPLDPDVHTGIRVGVIARATEADAWQVACERFPGDRKGQLMHQLAMRVSDSVWHKQLAELGRESQAENGPYWLWPFENYKTFCPYLVGSYERVAEELNRYVATGHRTLILDIPPCKDELLHVHQAFRTAHAQRV